MKIVLRKTDVMDDWYVIEPEDTTISFSDADVEGTAAEMLGIAQAIEQRGSEFFHRCSVVVHWGFNEVMFDSPRNSQECGVVTLAEADELAKEIREKLGTKESE